MTDPTGQAPMAPIRWSFQVACPPDHAFAVWTSDTSRWWPADHTVSGERELRVVFEPWVGGRVFERTPGGQEFDWGQVTTWDPPRRLGYTWHLRADRGDATDVEITFVEQDDATTRVDIDHRGWERLGAPGPARRDANRARWSTLLPHFVAACALSPGP